MPLKDNWVTGQIVGAADMNAVAVQCNGHASDKEDKSQKGVAGGYVPLNGSGVIDDGYLPGGLKGIEEYDDLASMPGTGETGKVYVAKDSGRMYRWGGSAYQLIGGSDVAPVLVASGTTTIGNNYRLAVFNGSGSITWTLPVVSGNVGVFLTIKNRGTGTLTVQRQGSDQIWNTSAGNSVTVSSGGGVLRLACDGVFWVVV
jgi:hypothetical protein